MVRSPDSGLKSPARMSSPHRHSDNEQQQQSQQLQQQQQQQPGKRLLTGNDLLAALAIEKMGQADSSKSDVIHILNIFVNLVF